MVNTGETLRNLMDLYKEDSEMSELISRCICAIFEDIPHHSNTHEDSMRSME